MTIEPAKKISLQFGQSANSDHATEFDTNQLKNAAYAELPHVYTYDNVKSNEEDRRVSCGQAAIATLFDYYNVSPYPLNRIAMQPAAVDGKLHYDNKLVDFVMHDFPPAQLLNFRFTTREIIIHALNQRGVKTNEAYAAAGGNGNDEMNQLKQWINKYKRPVLTLIDLFDLSKGYSGMGSYPDWYSLHWATVYGYTETNVHVASWSYVFSVPWENFLEGWHCKSLPYPNNFYSIYNYK